MKTWGIVIGIILLLFLLSSPVAAVSKSDLVSQYKTEAFVKPMVPSGPVTIVPTTAPTPSPSGEGWRTTTLVSAVVWGPTSLALDTAGNPHIGYIEGTYADSRLKFTEWTGSRWVTSTVDSASGRLVSLVLDSSGNPHIIYMEESGPPGDPSHGHLDLKYAKWTGSGWQTQTVDSSGCERLSLALDGSGNPHIGYLTRQPSYDLKYVKWTGSTWQTETVDLDCGSNVDGPVSLALDASGNPHISYFTGDPYYDLKYAERTGSAGWITSIVDSAGFVDGSASLELDASGNPHVSYNVVAAGQDSSGGYSTYDLKYARWAGSKWQAETVDSAGIWFATSLALDAAGNPHISYFTGQPAYDLKYAKWTGSAWQKETVDSAGIVGLYNSLALDAAGNPHISYVDYGELSPFTVGQDSEDPHYDLKYAYYSSSGSGSPTGPAKIPTKVPTTVPTRVPSETGALSISSSPAGALVHLDGVFKGITPIAIPGVCVGSHQVRLTKIGYREYIAGVTVVAGKGNTVTATLIPSEGIVPSLLPTKIPVTAAPTQVPPKWSILPDIYSKQEIPGTSSYAADLPPKCCANGSGIRGRIDPQPTPTFGFLEISSDPSGASVYIDVNPWTDEGTFIGITPVTVKVETGTHRLKLIKTGYSGAKYRTPVYGYDAIEISITEGETVRVSAVLIPGNDVYKVRLVA